VEDRQTREVEHHHLLDRDLAALQQLSDRIASFAVEFRSPPEISDGTTTRVVIYGRGQQPATASDQTTANRMLSALGCSS
jgi:hypothetical protein